MNAARKIGAVAVPLNYRLTAEEASTSSTTPTREIAYVDAEYAHLFAGLRRRAGEPAARHRLRRPGARRACYGEDITAGACRAPPDVGDDGRHRRHDDLHLGHDRQAEGRGPARRRPGHRAGAAQPARLPARTTSTSPPARCTTAARRVHGRGLLFGQTIVVQRKFDAEDWLRLVDKYKVTLHVLRAGAGPDGVRAAGGGEGPLRPLVHASHARQRRAVELRAQAAVRRRLPAGVAVGDLRLDRARRRLRAQAQGPDAQARLVRPAGARHRDRAVRRGRQRGHRHRARAPRRAVRALQGRVQRVLQAAGQLRRRTAAATSTPSATSPTGTTRATCTSATARAT